MKLKPNSGYPMVFTRVLGDFFTTNNLQAQTLNLKFIDTAEKCLISLQQSKLIKVSIAAKTQVITLPMAADKKKTFFHQKLSVGSTDTVFDRI